MQNYVLKTVVQENALQEPPVQETVSEEIAVQETIVQEPTVEEDAYQAPVLQEIAPHETTEVLTDAEKDVENERRLALLRIVAGFVIASIGCFLSLGGNVMFFGTAALGVIWIVLGCFELLMAGIRKKRLEK